MQPQQTWVTALQKLAKHKLLDSDGLCAVGESIENGEIFINKVSPTNTKDMLPMGAGNTLPDNLYKPTPMSYKGAKGETSVVDKVLLTQNDEQEDIFKVTCSSTLACVRLMSSSCCQHLFSCNASMALCMHFASQSVAQRQDALLLGSNEPFRYQQHRSHSVSSKEAQ